VGAGVEATSVGKWDGGDGVGATSRSGVWAPRGRNALWGRQMRQG
jgi:hypothetical protein